jgi:hypothetical protein
MQPLALTRPPCTISKARHTPAAQQAATNRDTHARRLQGPFQKPAVCLLPHALDTVSVTHTHHNLYTGHTSPTQVGMLLNCTSQ